MSADLLLAALVIDTRREPDFAAAHRAAADLRAEGVVEADLFGDRDPDEADGLRAIRDQVRRDLVQLEAAIASFSDLAYVEVRGARVYVTGASGGYGPAPLFDVVVRLSAVRGVLAAAGFEEDR